MAWLVRDGDVLAAVEVVDSRRPWRGVAGLKELEGALLLRRRPLVLQTLTAGLAVDVAFCDRDLRGAATLRAACSRRGHGPAPAAGRVGGGRPVRVPSSGGAWRVGDRLEVKGG